MEPLAADPYGSLRRGGTVGAYVMLHYPAIGLIDPSRMGMSDTSERVGTRFFGLMKYKQASAAELCVEKIRKAAKLVLTQSPLSVAAK